MRELDTLVGDGVLLGLQIDDAKSTLIQAMMDETVRLRKTADEKEKDSIRIFLTESYRVLSAGERRAGGE